MKEWSVEKPKRKHDTQEKIYYLSVSYQLIQLINKCISQASELFDNFDSV